MSGRVKEIRFGMNGQPITRTDKLVLLVLADYYCEKTKASWPSLDTLAEECLSSKTSLWRSLGRLEKVGLLKSQVGRWKEPEYSLLPYGDPPSHSNLKPDSHFKTDGITFQDEQDHISNLQEIPYASLENQNLTEREPIETAALRNSKGQTREEEERLRQQAEELRLAREERRAKKANGRSPVSFRNPAAAKGGNFGTRQSSEERRIAKQQRIREACERAQEKLANGTL